MKCDSRLINIHRVICNEVFHFFSLDTMSELFEMFERLTFQGSAARCLRSVEKYYATLASFILFFSGDIIYFENRLRFD